MREANMRMEKSKLLMALFLASEAVFFALLILAYVYFRNSISSGPTAASSLDPRVTAIYTIVLIASSGTIWLAERRLKAQHNLHFLAWLLLTAALGVVFLIGQGMEYARLLQHDVKIGRNLFAGSFFTLTGFHGFHVFIGVIALTTMLAIGFFGSMGRKETAAFASVALYWHFVDVVWIVIFSIVYLGTFV